MNPKVSFIMGVYNDGHHVDRAIMSVVQQTFTDWELIVCDDGSTDNSLAAIQSWERKDARIKALINEKNIGLASTLNRCLQEVKGEYVARQDSDDFSHPDRLERQISFLESNPEYALVSSAVVLMDDNGFWGLRSAVEKPLSRNFFRSSCFIHPVCVFRQSAIARLGGYRVAWETARAEDYDLFMRLYAAGYLGYNFMEPLLDYYESRQSMKKRKYKYRVGEAAVRFKGYRTLGLLPQGLPFVIKPLLVGLIPKALLRLQKKAKKSNPFR